MKKSKQKSMRSSVPIRPDVETVYGEVFGLNADLLKVCRLCGTKDALLLEIFDRENSTAKKIVDLLPFRVTENDDLPHKICFRCSAKLEELYEFVQKCTKTQENLCHAMGKRILTKNSHRSLWEEKLNRSNLTNDDICDAVIKKAMEGIKDISKLLSGDTKLAKSQSIENSLVKISKPSVADRETKVPDNGDNEEDITEIKNTFNIMDHVSMVKVNGVGVLFQCKLCNRNFFKKVVLLSHLCAKRGVAKVDFTNKAVAPEVPKISTVKYINTKKDDLKRHQGLESGNDQIKTSVQCKKAEIEGMNKKKSKLTKYRPKPKIDPASKVKRTCSDSVSLTNAVVASKEPAGENRSITQCSVEPSMNFWYKLAPGPNNTFTLVEEEITNKKLEYDKTISSTNKDMYNAESSSKLREVLRLEKEFLNNFVTDDDRSSLEVIELSDQSQTETTDQPYPVELFQTVHSK